MSNAASSAREAFDISDWRESVKGRRELVRSIIIRAVIGGEQLEPMINDLKAAVQYYSLGDTDQNLFRVISYDIRTVVGGWRELSPQDQKRFVEGKGAPSMLAAKIRSQRS